jgi:copper transport protein
VVLGIAVLAVTALLVNAQPARSALTPKLFSGSVSVGTGAGAMTIEATVDPAHVGLNQIHVYTLTPKGADLAVRSISAKLVDGTTSVPAGLVRGGANHWLTNSAAIPTPGDYQMLIEVVRIIDGNIVSTAGVLKVPVG